MNAHLRLYSAILFLLQTIPVYSQMQNERNDPAIAELNRKGIALSEDGRYGEAIDVFKQAVTLEDRRGSSSWHNMAYTYEKSGDRKKAIEAYKKALDRNPDLLPSLQNLSRLEYLEMNYRESIEYGERALGIDPGNKQVPRWLPDAYAKAAERRMFDLQKKGNNNEESTASQKSYKPDMLDRKEAIHAGFTVDGIFRYLKSSTSLAIHTQAGVTHTPANFYASARLDPMFEVKVAAGNPFFGLLQPSFMAGRQTIDYLVHHKNFYWGFGAMFTQVNLSNRAIPDRPDYLENTAYTDLSDTKFGFEIGSKGEDSIFRIRFFPRYAFRNPESAPTQNRLDAASFLLEYRTMLQLFEKSNKDDIFSATPGEFYVRFQTEELYINEYTRPSDNSNQSHWFGTYDIVIGMEFGDIEEKFNATAYTIGFEIGERLYFFDTRNPSLFGFGNSQGYFGFNFDSAVAGNSFPGFRSNSHVFTFYSRQRIFSHWIFSQKITAEFTRSAEPFHGIFLQLGLEARY